ncbi:MBL fold metallo-hydrolase [Sphingosinithalassobacter portus]|uniref:MBL fold metallo-hydrolase n=1 Tax=Stakelama portus TaxID=2676234 RepID=UPI000D6DDCC7|nr:MBL fold metallo-hydrolase [Sphingosinithalassobacter portus]
MRTKLAVALLPLMLGAETASAPPAAPAQDVRFVTLGTNSGPIPNPERAEPANLLKVGDRNILIDAGDGAAWQLAKAGVHLPEIHTIFISHLHFDHTGGLFALISQRYQMLEPSPLAIYGPPGTKALVDDLVAAIMASSMGGNNMRAFMPGDPAANLHVTELTDGAEVALGDVKVKAVRNTHYVATPGGDAPDALSFAYRFDTPHRSVVFTGDTGPSEAVEQLAKGADLLVAEVMDPDISLVSIFADNPDTPMMIRDMIADHFRREHLSPQEVGEMARRAGVKQLVLTHDAIPDDDIPAARETIAKYYAGPFAFANDLDSF